MKKLALFGLLVAAVVVSCSKEQKVVNKLEGTWKATSAQAEILGFELDVPLTDQNITYTFYECKVKKGSCDGIYVFNEFTDDFVYTIGGEGTTIDYIDSTGTLQSIEILELEDNTFKVKDDFAIDTTMAATEVTVTFTRQ